MNLSSNNLSALRHYLSLQSLRQSAEFFVAKLAVKSGIAPNRRWQRALDRWNLFLKLRGNKAIRVTYFGECEGRLTYYIPGTAPEIALSLRIPATASSDPLVFEQIFLNMEYQHALDWLTSAGPHKSMEYILDIGANIGCAALFFYAKYPSAHIFCLEPQANNYERLLQNLSLNPNGKIQCYRAAIWTIPRNLCSVQGYMDGEGWASRFIVENADDSNPDSVLATNVWQLLGLSGFNHVDLFKMDVEGAEATLLRDPDFGQFLKERVSRIAMEIHEDYISVNESIDILNELGFQTHMVGEFLCGYNRNI